jgi:hypothetical protein
MRRPVERKDSSCHGSSRQLTGRIQNKSTRSVQHRFALGMNTVWAGRNPRTASETKYQSGLRHMPVVFPRLLPGGVSWSPVGILTRMPGASIAACEPPFVNLSVDGTGVGRIVGVSSPRRLCLDWSLLLRQGDSALLLGGVKLPVLLQTVGVDQSQISVPRSSPERRLELFQHVSPPISASHHC